MGRVRAKNKLGSKHIDKLMKEEKIKEGLFFFMKTFLFIYKFII
jgi:hypothetical protein